MSVEAFAPPPEARTARIGPSPHARDRVALAEALDAVDGLPALAESRARFLRRVHEGRPAGDLTAVAESDPGLAIAVLRAARAAGGRELAGVADAVAALSPERLSVIAGGVPRVDYFERSSSWGLWPQAFRVHAVAVQTIAERIVRMIGYGHADELMTAALLHDVGKLALAYRHAGYADSALAGEGTPEDRIRQERERLGLEHATLGGLLASRWGLSRRVRTMIEQHHADEPEPGAALIALADMLAHHGSGRPVDHRALVRVARLVGLSAEELRGLLYRLPDPAEEHRGTREPSPLSPREHEVLRLLAEGQRYKEIAAATGRSESTVRTHINNVYKKLKVVDRAQAVLYAKERGWI